MQEAGQENSIRMRPFLQDPPPPGRALIALHVVDGPVAAEGNCKDLKITSQDRDSVDGDGPVAVKAFCSVLSSR